MKYIDIVDIRQAVLEEEIRFVLHKETNGEIKLFAENNSGERVHIVIYGKTEDVV